MIDLGLESKRALVAGAGHRPPRPGIGRETAKLLAEGGARVACVDLDEGRAEAVAAEVRGLGGEAVVAVGDLRRPDEVQRVVGEVVAAFGGLDICVDIIGEATWNITEVLSLFVGGDDCSPITANRVMFSGLSSMLPAITESP